MNLRARSFILLMGDYVLFFAALMITLIMVRSRVPSDTYLIRHAELFSIVFIWWLTAFYIEGLYSLRTISLKSLPISLVRAMTLSVVGSFIFFYLFPNPGITPKRNLFILALISMVLTFLWHKIFRGITSSDALTVKVSLLGDKQSADLIKMELDHKPYLGFSLSQTLNHLDELNLEQTDLLVVDRHQMKNPAINNKLLDILGQNKNILEMSRFAEIVSGKIPITSIEESWFLEACGMQMSPLGRLAKGLLDKSIAITLMFVIVPVYAVLLPLLLIFSGRPLFFTQTRTGLLNRVFTIYKLRTMVIDAEKTGAQWSKPGDARITPIGKFLRKTRLDELPQLWNILRGDMSIVGPRPERPEMISTQLAPKIPFYSQRHLVKPGVTGWAQVNFRYGFSTDDSLEKLQYDLYYVKNQNFWLDVRIILRTIKTVLTGAGQ